MRQVSLWRAPLRASGQALTGDIVSIGSGGSEVNVNVYLVARDPVGLCGGTVPTAAASAVALLAL